MVKRKGEKENCLRVEVKEEEKEKEVVEGGFWWRHRTQLRGWEAQRLKWLRNTLTNCTSTTTLI
jgi:hypothetical protein